jgi:hypothetical protein
VGREKVGGTLVVGSLRKTSLVVGGWQRRGVGAGGARVSRRRFRVHGPTLNEISMGDLRKLIDGAVKPRLVKEGHQGRPALLLISGRAGFLVDSRFVIGEKSSVDLPE